MTTGEALLALAAIVAMLIALGWLKVMRRHETVQQWQTGLLYRDGQFERDLPPGRHAIFDPSNRVVVARIDTVERQTRFGAIEVISADRFAFRLHLTLAYRISDPRAAYEAMQANSSFGDPPGLYDAAAAAALAEVGARGLDDVGGDPAGTAAAIGARLAIAHVEVLGLTLSRIELPPETRRMLTEAERARRSGLAQLERARGEQAALRSLANAARLVRDNPELAQLRLLQTIESAKGPTTIVVGDPRAAPMA